MLAILPAILVSSLTAVTCGQDDILKDIENRKEKTPSAETQPGEPSAATGKVPENAAAVKAQPGQESAAAEPTTSGDAAAGSDAPASTQTDGDRPGLFKRLLKEINKFLHAGAMGKLLDGGFFMWPILLMGILAVGVIIERYRSLRMLNVDNFKIKNEVQELLYEDKIEEALELCDAERGPVPAVLSAGLRKYYVLRKLNYDMARTEEQVIKAMDDYSVHIVAGLERHLPVLATISSAAPMLGFLGTVQGMIFAFQQIVEKMGETNIVEAAASGIQVSLLTTCFGLIVGIPAFVAFNYFTSVINRFVLEVEQSATELIEGVTIQLAAAGLEGMEGRQGGQD